VEELGRELLSRGCVGDLYAMMEAEAGGEAVAFREFKQGIFLAGWRPMPSEDEMRMLYRSFDLNSDGRLTFQEMQRGLEGGGSRTTRNRSTGSGPKKPLNKEEEREAKREAKAQRESETKAKGRKTSVASPSRSLDELRNAMRKKASVGQLVSMMDSNQNDKINFDEFKEGIFMCGMRPVPSDKEIELLFQSFDLNKDGALSYEEVHNTPLTCLIMPKLSTKLTCLMHSRTMHTL